MSTVRININGVGYEAEAGSTILQVAREKGINLPTFCWHERLSIAASCRMCLVEVAGAPKLLAACQTVAMDGMQVLTESDRVKDWRRRNLEFILLHHPVDCPICDAAGDCRLQDLYYEYDKEKSKLWSFKEKLHKSKRKVFGPHIVFDGERCILCTLCIRFCEEIWGEHLLDSRLRGNEREIIVASGETLDFPYSLMTAELCPVGALTNRDFRFKKRCWFLSSMPGICPGCATGCAAVMDHDEGTIYRMRPRVDKAVNDCWLCDDGVLAGELHNRGRLTVPHVREGAAAMEAAPREAMEKAADLLRPATPAHSAIVLSAEHTCEENLALMHFAGALGIEGQSYIEGRPAGEGDRLLRHKDKNPNRAGALKAAGSASLPGRSELVRDLQAGKIKTLICLGGEGPEEGDVPKDAAVITLAARRGNMTDAATVAIPAPSFAETRGRYINGKGMVRAFDVAIKSWGSLRPPQQVWETFGKIAQMLDASTDELSEKAIRDKAQALCGQNSAGLAERDIQAAGREPAAP